MRFDFVPLAVAFTLGACATAAVQSNAAPAPEPATHEAPPGQDGAPSQGASPHNLVVSKLEAPQRTAPNDKATITILARGENAFLGRLEMDAGAAVPEHADATEEYIHVVQGSGTMTIDGQIYDVAPGTTIYMPPGARVSFQNGDAPLSAIQVFAGPEPAAKYDAWTPAP